MTVNHNLILLVAAIVCFVISLLGALSVFNGVDIKAWELGGFVAFAAAHLP